jgi:hypothetical protein
VEPPALLAGVDAVPAMTLALVTTWTGRDGEARRTAQTVLRTKDRVLLAAKGDRSEWLFERNPLDPRRVTGYRIDHATKQVLVHDEAALRHRLGLRGWIDVLTLRFDPGALAALQATGERRTAGGAEFARYVARAADARIAEVWWSQQLLLPLQLTTSGAEGSSTSSIEAFEAAVDAARLADPRLRLPGYDVLDVTDAADRRSHHD